MGSFPETGVMLVTEFHLLALLFRLLSSLSRAFPLQKVFSFLLFFLEKSLIDCYYVSKILIEFSLIGNSILCRLILSVIKFVIKISDSCIRFCLYHSYDYRPNKTLLSPITIIYEG